MTGRRHLSDSSCGGDSPVGRKVCCTSSCPTLSAPGLPRLCGQFTLRPKGSCEWGGQGEEQSHHYGSSSRMGHTEGCSCLKEHDSNCEVYSQVELPVISHWLEVTKKHDGSTVKDVDSFFKKPYSFIIMPGIFYSDSTVNPDYLWWS